MLSLRRLPKTLAALSIGALLGLVLLEGGLQLVGLAGRGYDAARANPVQAADVADPRRVMVAGGCFTLGLGDDPEHAFPAVLERRAAEAGKTVHVVNVAVRGKGVDYFARDIEALLDEHRPQVLILAINDRTRALETGPAAAGGLILPRLVGRLLAPPEATPEPKREPDALDLDAIYRDAQAKVAAAPSDPFAHTSLANAYYIQGRYRSACASVRDSLALGGKVRKRTRLLIQCQIFEGDYPAALATLESARVEFNRSILSNRAAEAERDGLDLSSLVGMRAMSEAALDRAILGDFAGSERAARAVLDANEGHAFAAGARFFADFAAAAQRAASDPDQLRPSPELVAFGLLPRADQAVQSPNWEREEVADLAHHQRVIRESLAAISAAARERSVFVVAHNFGASSVPTEAIRAACAEFGIPLVDTQGLVEGHPERDALMVQEVRPNLTERGSEVIGDALYQALVEYGVF